MRPDSKNPQALLELIVRQNDEKAFESLFCIYYKKILHFTGFILNSKELAEEVTLDVFQNLWQQRHKMSGISNLNAYIYSSAKNAAFNYLDKLSRKPTVSINLVPNDSLIYPENPEQQLIDIEKFERIKEAISKLPPKCLLIFTMIFMDGLKYKEVAEILEISVKTVEAQMAIAMKRIADDLKKSNLF